MNDLLLFCVLPWPEPRDHLVLATALHYQLLGCAAHGMELYRIHYVMQMTTGATAKLAAGCKATLS